MELALALGMTLTELHERMPVTEMALWRAKWNSAPWGDRREDVRHAMRLRSFTAANAKKGKTIPALDEFFPFRPGQKQDTVASLAKEFGKAGNIKVKRS